MVETLSQNLIVSPERCVHLQCQDTFCINTFTYNGGRYIEEHPESVFL